MAYTLVIVANADVVTLFPTWLAPNLITLMGVVWLMAAYVLTMCYIPDYTGRHKPPSRQHQLVYSSSTLS